MTCVRCGGQNARTATICSNCGARLPRMDMASPETQVPVLELTERLNEYRANCDRVLTGEWTFEDFERFLEEARQSLRQRPRVNYSETGVTEETEEAEVDENWTHFDSALNKMTDFLHDEDPAHLDDALALIQKGNDKLIGSGLLDEVRVDDVVPVTVTCVMCSHANPASNSVCDQCGTKLPRVETGAAEPKRAKITDRYDRFKQAVDKVRRKEWSLDEFGNFLAEVERMLAQKREVYFGVVNESGYQEYASEEVELGTGGIDDYEKGVAEMWNYMDHQDDSALERALELMWEGNEKINKAMALNRSLRKELTDQFGYI